MNGPPTPGLFNMATRRRASYFTAYPHSPTPPRTDSWGVRPVRTTAGSKGTRGCEKWGASGSMMEKVKKNSIVLGYIAIIVTIMLLMMLGVL